MMININLVNSGGGTIATRVVKIGEDGTDEDVVLREAMIAAVCEWTLAVGDTIRIEEV